MIPLFFGPADHAKYGVFQPASGSGIKGRGIVFCDALFDEALRAHRALRFASDSMAAARWNSLRFDYFGTGDSAGDTAEFSIAQAVLDIHDAIEELKSAAELEQVYLLGLRLGGTLATTVAASRSDIRGIVLWDPIIDGVEVVEQYQELGQHDATGSELAGFSLSESAQNELRALSMRASLEQFDGPILMICTSPTLIQSELALQNSERVDFREIHAPDAWTDAPGGGVRPIPSSVIREIQGWSG